MYVNSPVLVSAFVCKALICGTSRGTAQVAQRTARCVRATVGVSGLRVFGKQGAQVCVLRLLMLAAPCVARVSDTRTLKDGLRIVPPARNYLFL